MDENKIYPLTLLKLLFCSIFGIGFLIIIDNIFVFSNEVYKYLSALVSNACVIACFFIDGDKFDMRNK